MGGVLKKADLKACRTAVWCEWKAQKQKKCIFPSSARTQLKTPDYMQVVTNQIFRFSSATEILLWVFKPLSHISIVHCLLLSELRLFFFFFFLPYQFFRIWKLTFQLSRRASQRLSCDVVWFFFPLLKCSQICSLGLRSCDCWRKAMRATLVAIPWALNSFQACLGLLSCWKWNPPVTPDRRGLNCFHRTELPVPFICVGMSLGKTPVLDTLTQPSHAPLKGFDCA